jgi:nucleoid-associated protein YgaU
VSAAAIGSSFAPPTTAIQSSDPGLVPVQSIPNANGAAAPKLISLPPTHLVAVPIDHSYVVQPGDTLWTIAERMYGDGRRWEVLQQANRDRMWNPRDLRPGMTLVVP